MSHPDVNTILKKIKMIRKDLVFLKQFEDLSFVDYKKDTIKMAAIERSLEKITGRLIDINYHILREEYEILPDDYRSSFTELGKNKVISTELAEKIKEAASLRNALAHEYDKIDDEKVYKSIKMALDLVPKYIKSILDFLS